MPQRPLAGLNVQKSSLLLYPESLCGTIERYHPQTKTFAYETLELPLSELRAAALCGIAHTRRITIAYLFLASALLSLLLLPLVPLWGTLLCSGGTLLLFIFLRFIIPIRLLRLQTTTSTIAIPIQWWERSDTTAFLSALTSKYSQKDFSCVWGQDNI